MILSDKQITQLASSGMISPFSAGSVNQIAHAGEIVKALSYGSSSYGYDIRLSAREFKALKRIPGKVVSPKSFDPGILEDVRLQEDEEGVFFILPAHTYALGVAVERLEIPDDVTVICIGKSTYCRCGVLVNVSPAEAGWKGTLTLEFSNTSECDVKIFANEGCAQLLFFRGEPCMTPYSQRPGGGKYQNQPGVITLPKV